MRCYPVRKATLPLNEFLEALTDKDRKARSDGWYGKEGRGKIRKEGKEQRMATEA